MIAARERNPVRLAILGLLMITVDFLLALNFQRLPLVGGGATYRAEFTDASGLVQGEEVRVAGVKVGAVTGIELGKARVVVSFQVKGFDLGRETTAGIEVKTLLGQHFLSVTPAGSGRLEEDSTIPLARTSTPVNIVPAFQRLTNQADDIDTAQVADAFDALSTTLTRTAPEMKSTLRGLSRMSHAVSTRDGQIRTLFSRANDVSGVVAARDKELAELLGDTNTVLAMLERRRETISQIIDGTSSLSRQLTGLAKDNRGELEPALAKLNGVLDVLNENKTEIDQIIKSAALYGREFANVGGSGRWFDSTIKAPAGLSLCNNAISPAQVSGLLNPVFSAINQAINGSSQPCLPLGPSTGGAQ